MTQHFFYDLRLAATATSITRGRGAKVAPKANFSRSWELGLFRENPIERALFGEKTETWQIITCSLSINLIDEIIIMIY